MKVTFAKNYDWNPVAFNGRVTVTFKAGETKTVTRECAEAAKLAGVLNDSKSRKAD